MGYGPVEIYDATLDKRMKGRHFYLEVQINFKNAEVSKQLPGESSADFGGRCKYDTRKINRYKLVGLYMEKTVEQLKLINEEVLASKKIIQDVFNEMAAVGNQLNPLFRDQIAALRASRMSAVSEVQATLSAMKDIRKFFLESDYEKEIKRLGEFVALCKELKALKEDGTLDALCDVTLKLALPGEVKQ